jgi:hypothetical protein
LVLVEVAVDDILVLPAGVAVVLDLLIVPELLVIVLDFDMPAGLVIVVDLVVIFVAGACEVVILVVFDELALMVLVVPVVAGAVVWARAAEPPSRLRETRKPRMRFIRMKSEGGEKWAVYGASGAVVGRQCNHFSILGWRLIAAGAARVLLFN